MATSTRWQLARETAERYQAILVPAILGPFAKALVVWADLQPGEVVLDVGCGTGAAARVAAERVGPDGHVTGVDVNSAMLDVARAYPVKAGAPLVWREGSADAVPLPDQSVDMVLCAQALPFFQDREAALDEMKRVLKPRPENCVTLSVWGPLEDNPYFYALAEAIRQHLGEAAAMAVEAAFALSDPSELCRLLNETGFSGVNTETVQRDLLLPPLHEFVPRHISTTPAAPTYEAASLSARQAVLQRMVTRLDRFHTDRQADGRVHVPFRAFMARGFVGRSRFGEDYF